MDATFNVGLACFEGHGTAVDLIQAAARFRNAAERGHVGAMRHVGLICTMLDETGEAVTWFRKGAEAGDAESMYMLGLAYASGTAVRRDYGEALGWFRKAADDGDAKSMYAVGEMYEAGRGVAQDQEVARNWYYKAAASGDKGAKRRLASPSFAISGWVRRLFRSP